MTFTHQIQIIISFYTYKNENIKNHNPLSTPGFDHPPRVKLYTSLSWSPDAAEAWMWYQTVLLRPPWFNEIFNIEDKAPGMS